MKQTAPANVLIVEDDRDISHLVELHLRDAGYNVDIAYDGADGLERALTKAYDLAILDLNLPGVEGLEICRRLRAKPSYPLILMLTARSSELDRVLGLEIGADDYLIKPFGIRELLARVKALLRRMEARSTSSDLCPEEEKVIRGGPLVIDADKRQVTLSGQDVNLTAKEFDLLFLLACHPARVYTRAQLLDLVWGMGYEGYEHTVNSHINRLRSKIEKNSAHPHYLLTAWGVGYKFASRDTWGDN
ncbi:DNA-binding response regulator [Capsulimonas corticalis]|uniref:DNA-binding response regulator n=1 Tax=Capsulimonas corticalis TaxID=2219043 RepID=A0A402CW71_9BACT|nr:response regulator transcription factor [Capsulimonas corticalis]BDI34055.1 DNA-binding response regulator [Capsulimonas corticalis]